MHVAWNYRNRLPRLLVRRRLRECRPLGLTLKCGVVCTDPNASSHENRGTRITVVPVTALTSSNLPDTQAFGKVGSAVAVQRYSM